MSHVCAGCGEDCTHLRAPPDPVYHLPIVVCPACGLASVRRATLDRWSRRRPGARILAMLVAFARLGTLGLLCLLSAAVVALDAGLLETAVDESLATPDARIVPSALFAIASLLGGSALVALCLRWPLGHLRPLTRILTWLLGVALLLWVVPNAAQTLRWLDSGAPRFFFNGSRHTDPVALGLELGGWPWLVTLAAATGLVLALSPLTDRFGRYFAQQAWLARLARARKRRHRA